MIYPFKHRCVQDLAWVIHSPPIISGKHAEVDWWDYNFFAKEYAVCLPALHKLDKDPSPLLNTVQQLKSKRLGLYFETLIGFWLTLSPNFRLLKANQAIRNQGQTLGELDFLIQEQSTGKIIHLEVAVKFYLGYGDLDNMANWYGPGLRDRLDIKYQHLVEHQTQLSKKHPELMEHVVDERACLIKGRLFYPLKAEPKTAFTASHHLQSRYLTATDFSLLPRQSIVPLRKTDWLAPLTNLTDRYPTESFIPFHVGSNFNEPKCFATITTGTENTRFFLLPDNHWSKLQQNMH